MDKRERIYIACPYSSSSDNKHDIPRIVQRNVDKAIGIGNKLREKGHLVYIPHMSHFMHIHYSNKKDSGQEYWYDFDNSFIDYWATALFFLGHSIGADRELERAKRLKLKIYRRLKDVPRI